MVGWLVDWLCLSGISAFAVTAGQRDSGQSSALETVQRGTEWGYLSVSVCASLSLSGGRGAEIAGEFWRVRGTAEDCSVPIANATCLSEFEAVEIDMDLVFAALLHSEVFLFVLARRRRCKVGGPGASLGASCAILRTVQHSTV